MSLLLFNAVPAGAIEVLSDAKGKLHFKRADLGRFLGIVDIKTSNRNVNVTTKSRSELSKPGGHVMPSRSGIYGGGKNPHDAFVDLEAALEIVVRSRKPKAVELTKWLTRKGFEKIQEEHQLSITDRDDRIQAIQYENVALQAQRDVYREQVTDLITHRHVPRCGDIHTVLVVVEKNMPDEEVKPAQHPYYMIRCQKKCLNAQIKILRIKYPNMIVKEPVCNDANSIHAWSRFKQDILKKQNYYLNHFSLPEESRELFEGMFGIEI